MNISEAYDTYIKIRILGRGCSPNTYRFYTNSKNIVDHYFGNKSISTIRPEDIAQFYIDLVNTDLINGQKHMTSTARREICTLKTVLYYVSRRGEKTCNIDDIEVPKSRSKPPRWLEKDEVDRFIDVTTEHKRGYGNMNRVRNELIMRMLFVSGVRISELVELNRDSIRNLEFVVVGKSKEPRTCYITQEIQDLINKYLSMRTDDNEAMFVTTQQGCRRVTAATVRRVFKRVSVESGLLGVHPHTMRHSFATYMLDCGADVRQVAALLGHESLETTKRYLHVKNRDLRKVHQKIMAGAY